MESNRFNTNQIHPLIDNSNEYIFFNKYVSIHSEDRDMVKYPSSSYFELDLPQDYLNISKVILGNYNFPLYYNIFSFIRHNIIFTFRLAQVPTYTDAVNNTDFTIVISEGTYTTSQMPYELMNKMNEAVTLYMLKYFQEYGISPPANYAYTDFVVTYNAVNLQLYFGNISSSFTITNENTIYNNTPLLLNTCQFDTIETFDYWGLPAYLGFFRKNATSIATNVTPQFYYSSGTANYWLAPPGTSPTYYVVEAPRKLNVIGELYFYLDIQLFNTMDELTPFSTIDLVRETKTNQSTGRNNSAFAKIPTNPSNQGQGGSWFNATPYKLFYPPAERVRKVRVKIRYHDGTLVDFNNFNYSFVLIFSILMPHTLRNSTCIDPTTSQGYNNSFGSK
jgi:hypothetical protein